MPGDSSSVPNRIRNLNGRDLRADGQYVLYWMTSSRRLSWNFALDRARDLARELRKPLVILEPLRCRYPWACARFHRFVLDGMAEHRAALADSDVTYYPYVEPVVGAGRGLLAAMATRATLVVTDDHPGFFYPRMTQAAADRLDLRLEAVDGCGLLPVREPGRAFATAYSFRRWLQKHLPDEIRKRWPAARIADLRGNALLHRLPLDASPAPVERATGGTAAARSELRRFVRSKLNRYAEEANRPESNVTSGLSPWLHFGHLSSHEVFAAVARAEKWSPASLSPRADGRREGWWGISESAESFLDQLVTWRELGHNAAAWLPNYDRWESLPDWARATLESHARDPREHLYSPQQLERAETHDSLWNAAQRQLVTEGRIHNYLRMLWGKKILKWTPTAQEALDVMLHLNDKYALDGRDPNSVSGIFWVLGRYDRPWGPEREIFGKVRYMTSKNTARKVPVKQYIERFAGAPQDLSSQERFR